MIGLIDCNNFFVSCERLFRPDLRGKPVAVLSSNDGCIVARSQEVKDLGIQMGAPLFQIEKECKKHGIVLFSSNFKLYRDISRRVMTALSEHCEEYEIYSIDEAFFRVSDGVTQEEMAQLRSKVMQKTGIPVSIGVAKTKTLAKVANGIAKKGSKVFLHPLHEGRRPTSSLKEGVCVMDEGVWGSEVKNMPCGSVWGVGRQIAMHLDRLGIATVGEFLSMDPALLERELGVVGTRLQMELSGVVVHAIGTHAHEVQESYTSTRSFGSPVTDKLTLMSALGYHVAHVAEKLRGDEVVASRITVIARGSRYGAFSHRDGVASEALVLPTDDTYVLLKEAHRLLDLLYDPEIPYKKAGVVVSAIEPKQLTSRSLFANEHSDTRTEVLSTLSDTLNKRFGRGAVRPGVTLGREKWQEKQESMSPEYTTQWTDIARVKAI